MEKLTAPSVCGTVPITIPPIILVPNHIGSVLVPPIRNGVRYVVAAEPDNVMDDIKPKLEDSKRLLGATHEIKSVSPMQLFNIQESSETEEASVMFGKFSESPLLHESSKDVTLVSGSHDLLDEMGPSKTGSGFVETSSETYLFAPLSTENILDPDCKQENGTDLAVPKTESHLSKSCSLNDEDEDGSADESKYLVKKCLDDENEEDSCKSVVVHIPENSSYSAAIKEELHLAFDSSCGRAVPFLIPANSINISLIPIMTMDALAFGNISLSPTSTPIKFQVIDNDGSVKRISVNPVCQTEKESIGSDLTTDIVEGSTLTSEPTSPLIAEIISSPEGQRPFKCELCSATFTRFGNYTRHKKIHTVPTKEDQRFRCEICSKSFIQRCDLTRHGHIHNGTEPHRCTICGKGYIRHSDLVIHQRFHNKEKPFCCPQCAKGFSQRGDLNRHLRSIHLQVKPLTCGHCQKKFAKEATLIRHMQVTHRDIILNSITKCSSESVHLKTRNDGAFSSDSAFLTFDPS